MAERSSSRPLSPLTSSSPLTSCPSSPTSSPSSSSSSSSSSSASPSPSESPQRSANDVYHIPELRHRILKLLGRRDLARFMRVEKKGMADVAKVLYHTMDYNHVRLRMSVATVSYLSYIQFVLRRADKIATSTDVLRRRIGHRRSKIHTYTVDA